MENFLFVPKAIAAALGDIGCAILLGGFLSFVWLRSEPLSVAQTGLLRTLRRVLFACAVFTLGTLPIQLWLLTATMLDTALPHDVSSQMLEVLTSTHAGRVFLPEFVLIALLLPISFFLDCAKRGSSLAGLSILGLLNLVRSCSGHAATDGLFSWAQTVQFFHLSATSIWAGGVLVAGLLVLPRLFVLDEIPAAMNYAGRLSQAATVSLTVVMLSGLYNGWRGLGSSLHPLTTTQWGRLLMVKSVLVGFAIVLGAVNRRIVRKGLACSSGDLRRLTQSMRWESAAMIVILTVSGFLANSPLGM